MKVILDCYTDEPAGLGVPPYLGVYPRYIAGMLMKHDDVKYLTIDDLRLYRKYGSRIPETKLSKKTDISIHNLSKNWQHVGDILKNSEEVYVIAGAHTSGKYLSALPGSLKEVVRLLSPFPVRKFLCGPSSSEFGSSFQGGMKVSKKQVDYVHDYYDGVFTLPERYSQLRKIATDGASIASQVFTPFIAELETGHGCTRKKGCSFCLEPLKYCLEFRKQKDILEEAAVLRKYTPYFRLGKQSCFYSYKGGDVAEMEKLLKGMAELKPKVLHIDNANPRMVDEKRTRLIVKYCTEGNVAAFGVESFDPAVIKANNLNSDPEATMKAIRIVNKIGGEHGKNGMPKLLPGINILFGLIDESKKTFDINLEWFKKMLDEDLLVRRINIRQVIPFQGTDLMAKAGNKFLKKNKKYYWKARDKIRKQVDLEMLKRLVPLGTVLKDVHMEIYDGKHSFGRQFGSYPLIVGVSKRVELGRYYTVKVKKHNLRSIEAELLN